MNETIFHGDLVDTDRILYTPSDFAKVSLLHLQEIGILEAKKPHISKREKLKSFLFIIIVSGTGKLKYDDHTYHLSAGDCVFIDCHKPYLHESDMDLWTLQWIHFYGPNISNIYEKYMERGGQPCFRPVSIENFTQTWASLYQIAQSMDYIRDMRINERLTILLTQLMEQSWNPDRRREGVKKQNLLDIKQYLDERFFERITLDDISERFFINKFYLTRVFKEQFGVSVHNYLLQIRITHAKQLLRFTDKTVEEIGEECGLGDLHYFSRVFKKVEGISPREYRKQW